MAANVNVQAAVAAIPAGRQRQDFDRTRTNLVNLGGFSQVNGGTTDKLLLSQLSILRDPILLAESGVACEERSRSPDWTLPLIFYTQDNKA